MIFCAALETVFLWSNYRTRPLSSVFDYLLTHSCRYLISTVWSSLDTILEIFCDRLWIEISLERVSVFNTVDSLCWFLFGSESNSLDLIAAIELAEKLRVRINISASIAESI